MRDAMRLALLHGFEVRHSASIDLPLPAQRLLALLALHGTAVQRSHVAGTLWPELSEERAAANLRVAAWRVRQLCPGTLESRGRELALDANVQIDVCSAVSLARSCATPASDADVRAMIELYEAELLPYWYDEWLTSWRERWDQTRVVALEDLADRLRASSRLSLSVKAASAAVRVEPFRETARMALISSYIAERNIALAHKELARFAEMLDAELGIAPSPWLTGLLRGRSLPA